MDVYLFHRSPPAHHRPSSDAHAGLVPRQTLRVQIDLDRVHSSKRVKLGKNLLIATRQFHPA